MEFDGCHDNVIKDEHPTDIAEFWERIKKQLLKVSAT